VVTAHGVNRDAHLRGSWTLKSFDSQPAFDRDLPAARAERPVAIHEEHAVSCFYSSSTGLTWRAL
jgi:hypothetical protein